jgi:hypothetical protein
MGPLGFLRVAASSNRRFDEEVDTASERREYLALVLDWLGIVEKELNRQAMIYTTRSFFRQMGEPSGFGIRPLWVAHYTTNPAPKMPSAWSRYTFWQFTDSGQVDGIGGDVDLNRFDGDVSDLKKLERGGPLVVPPHPNPEEDEDTEPPGPDDGDTGTLMRVEADGLNFRSEPRVASHTRVAVLSLAHPVEVLESGIDGRWARVRVVLNGDSVEGFVAERFLRPSLPVPRESLVRESVNQWLRFQRGAGKETMAPFFTYVGEMWEELGFSGRNGRDNIPWSAAFISFIVRQAGPDYDGFKFSARHSTYVHDAVTKKEAGVHAPFWGHRLSDYAPQPGDMIAEWRINQRTYDDAKSMDKFASHCDIVVRVTDSHAYTIGGNVSNSVFMRKNRFALDSSGKLKPGATSGTGSRMFAVLENRAG